MNCILKLTQSGHLGKLEQLFASTIRLQKCSNSAALLQAQVKQSRYLSIYNALFKGAVDSQREKSSIVKKITWKKEYSRDDDNLISKQIELYGSNIATGTKLAKELGLKEQSYQAILNRHKFHIANKPTVKGDFSTHEDNTIIDYVKKNGRSLNTIKDLTLLLGRGSPNSVRKRLLKLSSETVMEPKQWTLEEDEIVVKYIVKSFLVKSSNDLAEQIKLSDLENLTSELQRSPNSAYTHYYEFVLPILKTHTRGLPMEENWMWQKDLMLHIIEKNIEKWNDIDYYELLTKSSFVGQTKQSLARFARNLSCVRQNNSRLLADEILWKRAEKSYYEQSPKMLCFSETLQAKKLERIQNIIKAYDSSK